jgi:hypothetical protein
MTKRLAHALAVLALALAAGLAAAPTAQAASTVTLQNRTGGYYVQMTQCSPWGACTIWTPASPGQLSNTKCFKPLQVVHSQWGGGYFPGNIYCFSNTATGTVTLYYGIG